MVPPAGPLVFRAPCLLGPRGGLAFLHDRLDPLIVVEPPLDRFAAWLARVGAVLASLRAADGAVAANPEPAGDLLVQAHTSERQQSAGTHATHAYLSLISA